MTPWVVGADPGGRETGLVLCNGRHVEDRVVVVSKTPPHQLPDQAYLAAVVEQIRAYVAACPEDPTVAVEGLVRPTPQMGLTSVIGLIGTGMTFGAILVTYRQSVVVRPGGHGSHPLTAYPESLRPTRGQGKGTDQLRHTRSAYDIAHAGRIIAGRQDAARRRLAA